MAELWAPLVHSRTYEVDFRSNLIAVPNDFTDSEIEWVRKHILVSFRFATYEQLRDQPRWMAFKSRRHCVVGVTCMAAEVSADKKMHRDIEGRPLYVFLGGVSRNPRAPLPPMDLELFKPLFELLRERFWEKSHDRDKDRICQFDYNEKWPLRSLPAGQKLVTLNTKAEQLKVWSDEDRIKLWFSAEKCPEPVSLCMGLAQEADALTGPVLNVSIQGATPRLRPKQPAETKSKPSGKAESSRSKPARDTKKMRGQSAVQHEPKDQAGHGGRSSSALSLLTNFFGNMVKDFSDLAKETYQKLPGNKSPL